MIGKTFGERAAEMFLWLPRIVAVVTPVLASNQEMQDVVEIVVPLRGIAHSSAAEPRQAARLVAVVFKDEMKFAPGDMVAHRLSDFVDDVGHALVDNGVDGIEAQPVEVELLEPVEGVVYEEIAHRPSVPRRRNRAQRPTEYGGAR